MSIEDGLSLGQRAADAVARIVGSWPFILGQSGVLILWAALNATSFIEHWDPYPFILMNLVLSLQAAFTAPMIMMAQNRQANKDRHLAQKAWNDVYEIRECLEKQDKKIEALLGLNGLNAKSDSN